MKIFKNNNKGFTLIELLVVVAIVGLLSSVILASLNSARAKGRDAKRLQDMHQIQTALELYFSTNNQYPSTGGSNIWHGNCNNWGAWPLTGATGYIPSLAPTFISVLPTDPKPTAQYCYLYTSDSKDYMFLVYSTVEGTVPNSLKRPNYLSELDYAIYTPGAVVW
ncbi:MAG: type II secretion system protein [bacterium]